MFGITFGHGTIKKYVIYFGTLFNNVRLNRYDTNGILLQNMKVPLSYGPREKFLARLDGNPDLDRPVAIQLPRMSFEMTNIYYDSSRKGQFLNRITAPDPNNADKKLWQYSPVPYNLEFQLSIMVKNAEDGTFIIEQILPYFTPEWTATLKINPDLDIKYDIPLILDNITHEDSYEGSFVERRALIWTLNFSLKGWLFGPTRGDDGSIIKEIDINLYTPPFNVTIEDASPVNTDLMVNINITPGLNAIREPLNWHGDALAGDPPRPTSVASNTINSDDNYGFIIDFSENI